MNMLLHSLVAAFAALAVGFVWYNPKVFGNAWMQSIGKTQEELAAGTNMAKMMGLTFFFSFLVALFLHPITIHQFGLSSLLQDLNPNRDGKIEVLLNGSAVDYTNKFRSFKHGALHGAIASLFFALPIIGTNAIYERRGAKYIFINTGYWFITMAIMGGIVCAWV